MFFTTLVDFLIGLTGFAFRFGFRQIDAMLIMMVANGKVIGNESQRDSAMQSRAKAYKPNKLTPAKQATAA